MSASNRSKRFVPNTATEKIVPVLLVILVVVLISVIVVIGLSLMGIIPPA